MFSERRGLRPSRRRVAAGRRRRRRRRPGADAAADQRRDAEGAEGHPSAAREADDAAAAAAGAAAADDGDDHQPQGYALGRPDAPLTMVEFTDLQCPFCRQYMLTTFDEIKKNWIDTGKLRYISRDFPLEFHPQAMPAARAARCAGEQGKFWEMRLGLMRNANLLTAEYITRTASRTEARREGVRGMHRVHEVRRRDPGRDPRRARARRRRHADVRHGASTTATSVEGPMVVGALPYAQFDAKLKSAARSPDRKSTQREPRYMKKVVWTHGDAGVDERNRASPGRQLSRSRPPSLAAGAGHGGSQRARESADRQREQGQRRGRQGGQGGVLGADRRRRVDRSDGKGA